MIKHAFIQKKLFTYICQHCFGGGGGGGGGGDYAQIVPPKNYSSPKLFLVICLMVFTSVPTNYDIHCLKVTILKTSCLQSIAAPKTGGLVGIILS